jgi:hypothetical protein
LKYGQPISGQDKMSRPKHEQTKKTPTAQMAHLVLPDTQADPSQNQKSIFCQRTSENVNFDNNK